MQFSTRRAPKNQQRDGGIPRHLWRSKYRVLRTNKTILERVQRALQHNFYRALPREMTTINLTLRNLME